MIKIIFFDTETTWVGSDDRIMQFGAIYGSYDLEDSTFYTERQINQYINSEKEPHPKALEVHWINYDFVKKFGTIQEYIKEFMAYISKCDYIVGHNIEYDLRMLRKEMDLLWIKFELKPKTIDTMLLWVDVCKINWNNWFKWPKLQELHTNLFWQWFDGAHDAMSDIIATKDCLLEMIKKKYFTF